MGSHQCSPRSRKRPARGSSAGIKLGIVSNGSVVVQEAKIEQLRLSALVDVVLISEREGVRKPNPEIFHRALATLGVAISQTWFIGDNPWTRYRDH